MQAVSVSPSRRERRVDFVEGYRGGSVSATALSGTRSSALSQEESRAHPHPPRINSLPEGGLLSDFGMGLGPQYIRSTQVDFNPLKSGVFQNGCFFQKHKSVF